jgi:hypothetical protein
MIYYKACPKCKGDVELIIDSFGKSLECLQCSFTVDSALSAQRAIQDKHEGATKAA